MLVAICALTHQWFKLAETVSCGNISKDVFLIEEDGVLIDKKRILSSHFNSLKLRFF